MEVSPEHRLRLYELGVRPGSEFFIVNKAAFGGLPVVAVATMVDVSEKDGQKHPVDKLAEELGIPISFVLMWFLFKVAGEWGSPVQDFFDRVFSSTDEGFPSLANGITYLLTLGGLQDGWLHSFLIGGLCTGLGVVSSFIPLMFIIFLMISILEDSGLSTVPRTSRVPGSACFRDLADYVAACVGLRKGRRQDYLGNGLRCVAHGCNSHGGKLLFCGFRTPHGRFSLRAHRPGA